MSKRGVLGPKVLTVLGSVPKVWPCKLMPFCSHSPTLPGYFSGMLGIEYQGEIPNPNLSNKIIINNSAHKNLG